MPSSYSPNLKIELIGIGEQTDAWGTTTNDNFENVFEEAITGMATATFPLDNDYDWAAGYVDSVGSQAQRNLVIEVTGTISATRNFIVPTIEKQYLVYNNTIGAQSIVVKTLAGTGITVPNGQRAHLFVNGTDVVAVVDYFPTLRAGVATLDTALPVSSGGTGQTNLASVSVGSATTATTATTATNIAGGTANQIPYNTGAGATSFIVAPTVASTFLQWDGTAFTWAAAGGGGGGVTSFSAGTTGLTPNSATTGVVTLGGTLAVANGGTGQTSLSNVSVGSASNVAGGAANQLVYNTNPGVTAFLAAPTVASTYLQWSGSALVWAALPASVSSFSAGTTGLTPSVSTTGAVTLAGTLGTANGGSGRTDLTYPTGPDTVAGIAATQTLTNKKITKRVSSAATIASPLSWNSNNFDQYVSTGQTTNLVIDVDAGAPTNGQVIIFRIKDNGISRSLTFTTGLVNSFRAVGVVLPTTTVANKVLYVGAIYNANESRWDVVAVAQEA
jgi:hypothetical protein